MVAKVMGIINYITYIAHGPHDANVLSRDDVLYCIVLCDTLTAIMLHASRQHIASRGTYTVT